jgi:hypothetical protein
VSAMGFEQSVVDLQGVLEVLINLHNRCLVTASVAVVWCCTR